MEQNVGQNIDVMCNAAAKGDTSTVRICLNEGIPVDARNSFGRTALQVVMLGHSELVELLLRREANPDLQDIRTSRTVCHDVCSQGFHDTLRVLVKYGAKLNIEDIYGNLPIHYAAKNNNIDIVQYLSCAMFTFHKNLERQTPLDILLSNASLALPIRRWVLKEKGTPATLRRHAVSKIREVLGRRLRSLNSDPTLLPLPSVLVKEVVTLETMPS